MTGFGDRDEEYGLSASGGENGESRESGENEENAAETRAWFAQSVGQARPRLGFTAEDLVLGGRRKVRRRRVAGALASTASVAAVAVAVTAFSGGGGGSQVVAGTGSTPTAVSSSPSTPGSPSSPGTPQAAKLLSDQKTAYAVLSKLFGELDPGGKHLTTQSPLAVTNMGFLCSGKTHLQISYSGSEEWTVDGRPAVPRKNDDTTPMIEVTVMVTAAGYQQNVFGEWGGFQENWGPIARNTLPDGSQLQTGTAGGGHAVQAVRTLPDGRQLVVSAVDGSVHGVGLNKAVRPTDPFPYTADQLGQIVAGSSLPLPFANGALPNPDCSHLPS